ncbi:MAG: aminopeptidase [Flammeovirgaceae bacterium]|nr:aminopeptidase [Flammeovirgaceae bacterium]
MMIRKVLFVVLSLLLIMVIWNWSLIRYGVSQGWGQLKIVWQAKPLETYLNDSEFPDSLKSKIRLVGEIRQFAIDSLGLSDTDNYQTMFDQKGEELMWVITACEPFRIVPKTWSFPIVGEVPYKGYFVKDRALLEREQLMKEGWDVNISNPGGWSTLGWFNDPILSGMLQRSEGDLASLVIHEMVHSTLFVKDSVEFNENLASFIGDTSAYRFLINKYGLESDEFSLYSKEEHDYKKYVAHMLRGLNALEKSYQEIENDPDEMKRSKKEMAIRKIVENMDTLSLSTIRNPSKRFSKQLPNNAYFVSFRRYQSKQGIFKSELDKKFKGDVVKYIEFLKQQYPTL